MLKEQLKYQQTAAQQTIKNRKLVGVKIFDVVCLYTHQCRVQQIKISALFSIETRRQWTGGYCCQINELILLIIRDLIVKMVKLLHKAALTLTLSRDVVLA